jgi:RNA polymerase sigma factor (TIGR02999 family)
MSSIAISPPKPEIAPKATRDAALAAAACRRAAGSDESGPEPRGSDSRSGVGMVVSSASFRPSRGTMEKRDHAVTQALAGAAAGNREDADRLWQLTYEELHRIAERQLMSERADHTLRATALVNEAYLRLVGQNDIDWNNRAHFFGVASRVCRRILVDYARKRNAQKRGGVQARVTLDSGMIALESQSEEVIALNEALERLNALSERLARVVECRYFGGLSEEETAEVLAISVRTVRRDWVKAKGWLYNHLYGDGPINGGDDEASDDEN